MIVESRNQKKKKLILLDLLYNKKIRRNKISFTIIF